MGNRMTKKTTHTARHQAVQLSLKALFLATSALTVLHPQTSHAYVYTCEPGETRCVPNYNKNAITENAGIKTYDLVRITMTGGVTKELGNIKSSAKWLDDFFLTASRGQLRTKLNKTHTIAFDPMSCKEVKAALPNFKDQFYTIRVFPYVTKIVKERGERIPVLKPLCGSSNAGGGNANLVGTLKRDFAHEVGHLLGLKHGDSREANGSIKSYGDGTTIMGRSGSYNYSIPQLHWLGWTQKNDIVQLDEKALRNGGTVEVTLRPTDKNTVKDSNIPMSYVYDLSPDKRLFIGIPQSIASGRKGAIPAGRIAFYTAPKCKQCRGMAMSDTLIGSIFNTKISKEYQIEGLVINPIRYESQKLRANGTGGERITSVTLQIRLAP
ncbi:Hypothetical protein HDN1F_28870 [gamma proteobacterium HdN1]|nr:Hypothetical protein HDN1F_28870 [gamma proteobacterium HdN1]